jgi:hypothetical protein
VADPVSVEAAELVRQAERVADRLGVVAPRVAARLAHRDSPADEELLADVRAVLQQLADLAAGAEDRALRPVPVLAARALGDQVLVLTHDVAAFGDAATRERAHTLLGALASRI